MINLVKTISSKLDASKRIISKVLRYGKDDVQEAYQAAPHGVDARPINDLIAVYAHTGQKGQAVIVGYINKNAIADVGELRLYSTNTGGTEQNYVWIKNDGTIEVGGSADNMVRYSKLEEAFNQLQADFDDLVTKYNTHTHPFVNASGTPSVTSATTSIDSPSTANISPAKISEIKTS